MPFVRIQQHGKNDWGGAAGDFQVAGDPQQIRGDRFDRRGTEACPRMIAGIEKVLEHFPVPAGIAHVQRGQVDVYADLRCSRIGFIVNQAAGRA